MLTWLLASRGTTRLAMAYLVLAALALVIAVSVAAMSHNAAASHETLQLHVTRYRG